MRFLPTCWILFDVKPIVKKAAPSDNNANVTDQEIFASFMFNERLTKT